MWKFSDIYLLSWEPHVWGKGYVHNGKVTTWGVKGKDGFPHHRTVKKQKGIETSTADFWIDPKGKVYFWERRGLQKEGGLDRVNELIKQHDHRLKPQRQSIEQRFHKQDDQAGFMQESTIAKVGAERMANLEQLEDMFAPFLSIQGYETPNSVIFDTIDTNPDVRSQGYGSRFMTALKHYVDQTGKSLMVKRVENEPFFSRFPWLEKGIGGTWTYFPQASSTEPETNPSQDEQNQHGVQFSNEWDVPTVSA